MRGTLRPRNRVLIFAGIIPAYAGNTAPSASPGPSIGDHPRVCGEHWKAPPMLTASMGSSPRMRGTLHAERVGLGAAGIIPAYAGNTEDSAEVGDFPRDHPRVCGEHRPNTVFLCLRTGSSPRMRGTPHLCYDAASSRGIIPAYAGNTVMLRQIWSLHRDHPRVCGEHIPCRDFRLKQAGSSPRMRGTPHAAPHRSLRRGIIPAYAGNTPGREAQGIEAGDHPRVCGEHPMRSAGERVGQGSSPRMRGTRQEDGAELCGRGIIPAYAGNTSISSLVPP